MVSGMQESKNTIAQEQSKKLISTPCSQVLSKLHWRESWNEAISSYTSTLQIQRANTFSAKVNFQYLSDARSTNYSLFQITFDDPNK